MMVGKFLPRYKNKTVFIVFNMPNYNANLNSILQKGHYSPQRIAKLLTTTETLLKAIASALQTGGSRV
jgi:hypothetical protein